MRLLFLDFDGVLNNWGYAKRASLMVRYECGAGCGMDPANVAHLNKIVAATDCTIILSTAWRVGKHPFVRAAASLKAAGYTGTLPRYATPDLADQVNREVTSLLIAPSRSNEIREWLRENTDVFSHTDELRFVVLDDSSDAWPVTGWTEYGHFAQPRPEVGLTAPMAENVISWLLGGFA